LWFAIVPARLQANHSASMALIILAGLSIACMPAAWWLYHRRKELHHAAGQGTSNTSEHAPLLVNRGDATHWLLEQRHNEFLSHGGSTNAMIRGPMFVSPADGSAPYFIDCGGGLPNRHGAISTREANTTGTAGGSDEAAGTAFGAAFGCRSLPVWLQGPGLVMVIGECLFLAALSLSVMFYLGSIEEQLLWKAKSR